MYLLIDSIPWRFALSYKCCFPLANFVSLWTVKSSCRVSSGDWTLKSDANPDRPRLELPWRALNRGNNDRTSALKYHKSCTIQGFEFFSYLWKFYCISQYWRKGNLTITYIGYGFPSGPRQSEESVIASPITYWSFFPFLEPPQYSRQDAIFMTISAINIKNRIWKLLKRN